MLEEIIYKNRFINVSARDKLWKILVKDFFQKFIEITDSVLDVPCGYCEFINNIECKYKTACDINPASKKYAKKDVSFIKCSSINIKIENKSIEKIFTSNFFEHLTRKEIVLTIKEYKRVLKKGGKVLLLQPNIRFCSNDYWMFFDHITPIDDRALEEIFSISGFKLQYKVLKFLPYTTKSNIPQSSLLVQIYLKLPILWSIFGKQTFMIFEKLSD